MGGQHRRRRGRAVYPAVALAGVLVAGAAVLGRSLADRHTPPEAAPPRGYNVEKGVVPVFESLRYLLNYYEFICAGIALGDLDERLIRQTMRGIFVNFHDFTHLLIEEHIANNGQRNELIYCHYRQLVARFR